MRELDNDVIDMMTSWHLRSGSTLIRGRPSMTVGELIGLLGQFDPGEEIFVLDSCDCCLTGFENLDADCVGVRDASMDDMFDPDKGTDELIAAHEASPRLDPLPPSKWMRRGVVIASVRWVHYPEVKGKAAARVAAIPGARHIDDELIAELKAIRQARAEQ